MMTVSSRTIAHEDVAQRIHGVHVVQATPYSMCTQLETNTITITMETSTISTIITITRVQQQAAIQKISATGVAASRVWIACCATPGRK